MNSLLPVFILIFVSLGFGALLVLGTSFIGRPHKPHSNLKTQPYECGVNIVETDQTNIHVRFYLTAILFILFDIEIIFMYPWAVYFVESFKDGYALQILVAMGVFLFIFLFGLFWEIRSKALKWE